MSQAVSMNEYIVRVPKKSKKNYHMMRFHTGNGVDFKMWHNAKMERENNFKEYKNAEDDQPKYGAGSEFGREQRDEARRKKHGIRVKKYKAEDQPWLLSIKDKNVTGHNPPSSSKTSTEKKFKGIREGGVSENAAWYVFLQAKDGAFEAYPVEEWYNFQPINRYKALNAEEAEKEFEKRDKIMNYFSVMYQKKLRNEEEDAEEEGNKKKAAMSKALMLSEMDDWMSDRESEEDGDDSEAEEKKPKTKKKKPSASKKSKKKAGGKRKRTDDGGSGTDCEEESDEYDEGAEHEYISEDSSDPEQEDDEKVTKDLAGVEEDQGLKKLLNSDDEEDEEDKNDKKDEEEQKESDEEKKKKNKGESSPDFTDSSDEEKSKSKDSKKNGAGGNVPEKASEALKRKLLPSGDDQSPLLKRQNTGANNNPRAEANLELPANESSMFEEQIRRYLLRKPMTTTEILQKLKNKKTGHSSEQLVHVIAVMLKKINPNRQRVKGKMYLSLKA